MITIVDYKVGNLGSISNMLKRIGSNTTVTSDKSVIKKASKLILPGVGSFDTGMENLKKLDLIDTLNERILNEKIPVIGICLGMHLLTKGSEEGLHKGLGYIDAVTRKFSTSDNSYKIPHMGWNYIKQKKESLLLKNMYEEARFYFVHSYFVETTSNIALTTTNYTNTFCSSFECDNIIGVQFHPEKSHKFGMKLLQNYSEFY